MKVKIFLDNREGRKRDDGFSIVASVVIGGKRKVISLQKMCAAEDWDFETNLPKTDQMLRVHIVKKSLFLEELSFAALQGKKISFEDIKNGLVGSPQAVFSNSFYSFYDIFCSELKESGKDGSLAAYKTAFDQLKKYRENLVFADIDYNLLNEFKKWRLRLGNSKNTVHTYLRKYRAVYNEAVRRQLLTDEKPFQGVFKGVIVKANRTKKKNISMADIQAMENAVDLTVADKRSLDLWLLLFYFGGQDLKDLYYLERTNIAKNRVYFERSKLDGDGYQFDLKIVKKAKIIIDRYAVPGRYIFPWRKDYAGYKTFRDNFRRSILRVQKKLNIQVIPLGGNLGIKVARHTFANVGKQCFIDTDLLRELMGHERDDMDTIYKDKYPEKMRDDAHLKIIG